MSATALLSELRRRDIRVQVVGSDLRCNAPAGALTPELRDQLRQYKNDVVQLLALGQELAAQHRGIVPLQRGGSGTPVFAVPGHNGDVFCYRIMARCLGEEQPFYALQLPGVDGQEEPLTRVEDLAAYFAEQIRAFRPDGPCIIAGFCAGGTVAFELAQQLARAGTAIRFVALFGSPYPRYWTRRAQLWHGLGRQVERLGMHARALTARSWSARRRYFAEKLDARRARRDAERAEALDPVLALREKVGRATVSAVRRYTPRYFAGRVILFLPAGQWLRSGVDALRWRALAEQVEEHFGPEVRSTAEIMREPKAAAFAELFRRCCENR